MESGWRALQLMREVVRRQPMGIGVLAVLSVLAAGQAPDSQLLASATAHLATHPVETMLSDTVVAQVRSHAFLTLPGDSQRVLFLSISPKYRQTPTILVYRRSSSGQTERLYEGLAPGRPVPVSGRFVDSHTLGIGVDLTFEGMADSATVARVIAAARTQHMHLVRYPRFLHADMRGDAAGFVDMTTFLPDTTAMTCGDFEFTSVDAMQAGHLRGDARGAYLVVLTPVDLVTYRFERIAADGRLVKRVSMSRRAADLRGLALAPDGAIDGISSDGRPQTITAPQ